MAVATIMLCVGPLWTRPGMRMSMSGSIEKIHSSSMFVSFLVILLVVFPAK